MGLSKDIPFHFDAHRAKPPGDTSHVIHRMLADFWGRYSVATLQDFEDSLPRDPANSFYADLPAAKKRTASFVKKPRAYIMGYVRAEPFGVWRTDDIQNEGGYFTPIGQGR